MPQFHHHFSVILDEWREEQEDYAWRKNERGYFFGGCCWVVEWERTLRTFRRCPEERMSAANGVVERSRVRPCEDRRALANEREVDPGVAQKCRWSKKLRRRTRATSAAATAATNGHGALHAIFLNFCMLLPGVIFTHAPLHPRQPPISACRRHCGYSVFILFFGGTAF